MTGGLAGEHGRTEMNPRRYLRNLCSPGMAIIYNHHAKTGGAQLAVETHTFIVISTHVLTMPDGG